MKQYSSASRQLSVKKAPDVGSRVVDFLRARYPQKTAEHVSADTGIATATIGKWMERASVPGGVAVLRLTAAYGPDFLAAAMHSPPDWLVKAKRQERQAHLDREMARLRAEMEGL